VDLPTIIESQKTIDRKTFYKTADISQIVICKEGEPSDEEDNPTLNNGKKYDPNKVKIGHFFSWGGGGSKLYKH
jgi:TATA-binding protein-associated factor Taf7